VFNDEVEVGFEGVVSAKEGFVFIFLAPLFNPTSEKELIIRFG